jgi:hypothetical protein
MPASKFCPNCGAGLSATAKFCQRCGTPRGGAAAPQRESGSSNALPWAVAALAILCIIAFVVGRSISRDPVAGVGAPFASGASGGLAPDISRMGPDERADRLFQRVMEYVEQGKNDSVQFFSPMAIQSMLALEPLDAHRRYDAGLLGIVSGDASLARAQADTILAEQPTHLLGLILAMRTAGMQRDTLARRGFANRFLKALDAERAKRLPEYQDHAPDIDGAVRDARAAPSAVTTPARGTTPRPLTQ